MSEKSNMEETGMLPSWFDEQISEGVDKAVAELKEEIADTIRQLREDLNERTRLYLSRSTEGEVWVKLQDDPCSEEMKRWKFSELVDEWIGVYEDIKDTSGDLAGVAKVLEGLATKLRKAAVENAKLE